MPKNLHFLFSHSNFVLTYLSFDMVIMENLSSVLIFLLRLIPSSANTEKESILNAEYWRKVLDQVFIHNWEETKK